MELKKNPDKDLTRFTALFFNLGLAISIGLVLVAFEWRSYDDGKMVTLNATSDDFEELLDIPITEQPPPPPPKQKVVELIEIPDEEEIEEEIEIDLDIEMTEEMEIEEIIETDAPEEEDVDQIFTIVEERPVPVVGFPEYYKTILSNLKYPSMARRLGIEGKVFVQFIVDKDGEIQDLTVIRGLGAGIDEEAIRAVKNGPKWKPGKQRGRPVKVKVVLPITFNLG